MGALAVGSEEFVVSEKSAATQESSSVVWINVLRKYTGSERSVASSKQNNVVGEGG